MTDTGEEVRVILHNLLEEQQKTNQLLHLLIQLSPRMVMILKPRPPAT